MDVVKMNNPGLELTSSVELITPFRAEELLKNMAPNRSVSEKHVRALARSITSVNWVVNGETLKINSRGELIDGQHRLRAVIMSGLAVHMVVVRNVPDSAMDTIDTGRQRRVGDVLAIAGIPNANAVAAAHRVIVAVEAGDLNIGQMTISAHETHEWLDKHPEIEESIRASCRLKGLVGKGMAAGIHFLFARLDRVAADKFFEALGSGTNLTGDDPVHILRERLIRVRSLGVKQKISKAETIALFIRAWNARRRGDTLKVLRGLSELSNGRYAFPEIV